MPSQTLNDKLKRIYGEIDQWRNRPLDGEWPYVFVDGVWYKRSWGGSVENASVLVAIGVDCDGHREVIAVDEGMREDAASWEQFFRGHDRTRPEGRAPGDRRPVRRARVHRQLDAAEGEVPAVHGAFHAQRPLQDAAQPPRMDVRRTEGDIRHGIQGDGPHQGRTSRRGDGVQEAEDRRELPAVCFCKLASTVWALFFSSIGGWFPAGTAPSEPAAPLLGYLVMRACSLR